jgi:hypothetical protein
MSEIYIIDWNKKSDERAREIIFTTDSLKKALQKLEELLEEDIVRHKIEKPQEDILFEQSCICVKNDERYFVWQSEVDGSYCPIEVKPSAWTKFKKIKVGTAKNSMDSVKRDRKAAVIEKGF